MTAFVASWLLSARRLQVFRSQLAAERKDEVSLRKELAVARGDGRSGESCIGRQGSQAGWERFQNGQDSETEWGLQEWR